MNMQNIDQTTVRQAELAKRLGSVTGLSIAAIRTEVHAIGKEYPEFTLWGPEQIGGKVTISILPRNTFADEHKLQDVHATLL